MGIEFINRSLEHRRRLEQLMQRIDSSPETVAEVVVEPEGLESESAEKDSPDQSAASAGQEEQNDALVELFETAATLTREEFLRELQEHKRATLAEPVLSPHSPRRREPRIEVSRPVEFHVQDSSEETIRHNTSMIDVSHHGARIDHAAPPLKPGDPVHLVSGGGEARFRVIWVGAPGTAQEGQVGLQKMDE
jgi:hypothetical protein